MREKIQALQSPKLQDDWWGVDGARDPRARPYEVDFGSLLEKSSNFPNFLKRREETGASTHVLDLFGSGVITTDFSHIDSATGVRLVAGKIVTRIPTLPKGHQVIAGDLFSPSTWTALEANLRERGIDHIDVLTIRPVGAFSPLELLLSGRMEKNHPSLKGSKEHLLEFYRLFMGVVERGFALLGEKGVMFVQLPTYGHDGTGVYHAWSTFLRNNAIQVQLDPLRKMAKLSKTSKSPANLPPWPPLPSNR